MMFGRQLGGIKLLILGVLVLVGGYVIAAEFYWSIIFIIILVIGISVNHYINKPA